MLAFLLNGCITPFVPQIEPSEINKYVVSGMVSDLTEIQTVSVSMTSSINSPELIPVRGCSVVIKDDAGNEFRMQEYAGGIYRTFISRSYLVPGVSFKIEIVTDQGVRIESDYDKLYECPEIDSIYYLRREIISGTRKNVQGIQLYLDLDGKNTDTRFFRWELTETWEYQVPYAREWYYDGQVHHIQPPDYSRKVCWSEQPVKNIFTLSTLGLISNKYEMLPLNFVDNQTSKLLYGYSLMTKQFSMSEAAYSYWEQLRINSNTQGNLYEKQPVTVTGNLTNISSAENEVIGFFGASSVKTKRMFIRNVKNLKIDYEPLCTPAPLERGFREISPEDYPAFLAGNDVGFFMIHIGRECVDCLIFGGINIKPDYWPW
jgi:hypothetical protein